MQQFRISFYLKLQSYFIILFLCVFQWSYGQQLLFEKIGVKSGLSASEVYNLFQDDRGYIWVFTEYGIVKYNGTSYTPVCKNLDLKHSAIYAVTASPNGSIYVVNSLGEIYRIYNDLAFQVIGTEKITKSIIKTGGAIYELFLVDNGDLHLNSVSNNSYKIARNQLKTKELGLEPQWKKSLDQIHIKKSPVDGYSFRTNLISSNNKIKQINDNQMFTFGRFYFYQKGKFSYYNSLFNEVSCRMPSGKIKKFKLDNEIIRVRIDPYGHIWLCTYSKGLIELDQYLNVLNVYFENRIISEVLFDNQNGVWVSTIGNGVYHSDNYSKRSFSKIPSLHNEITYTGVVNKNLFVGTIKGELFVFNNSRLKKIKLPSSTIVVIDVKYFDDEYYVSTKSGTYLFDKDLNFKSNFEFSIKNGTYYKERKYNVLVYSMEQMGKEFFVVLDATHLLQLSRKDMNATILLKNGRNRHMVKRFHDEYFISTPEGIIRLKNGKIERPACLNPIKDKQIANIVKDKLNNLWFCTKEDGIYCLSTRNKLTKYPNLPSKIINNINFTQSGLVLLSTNEGAFVTKLSSINSKKSWKLILKEEALSMTEFGGNIYVGSKDGLVVVDIEHLVTDRNYRFYLTSLKDEYKRNVFNSRNSLNYTQNNLYFNYDFIDLQPHQTILKYELTGPTNLSGIEESGQLYFQNLEPGNYALKVYPQLNFGDGAKYKQLTRFTIQPAFWQTKTFYFLSILLFTILVFFISLILTKRRNDRIRVRESMEQLLAEYRLTALKSQVNPHFMSNSLVAIQGLILNNDTDGANLYLAKFSLLLRTLLDYSNKSNATIANELKLLELYIELEQLRFSNKFKYELRVADDVDVNELIIPTLITQPFVENAIWHGLLPLKDHSNATLVLEINYENERLVISISDNGVGRSKNAINNDNRVSRGAELIVGRLEALNKLYKSTEARVEFIDNVNDTGNSIGTTVRIIIPTKILDELYEH